jgi:hypothetical protein
MRVRVSNGKYAFRIDAAPILTIERNGEVWHQQGMAFNAIHSMMCELDAARVVVTAARRLVEQCERGGYPMPNGLKSALERHASLVDDRELPSDWCGGTEPF